MKTIGLVLRALYEIVHYELTLSLQGLGAHSVAVETAVYRGEGRRRRVGKVDLRRRFARFVLLLEAGAVSATGRLYSPLA